MHFCSHLHTALPFNEKTEVFLFFIYLNELAILSFQCMLFPVLVILTRSPVLFSTLLNPVAVKQIVKWHVSTFRQHSNPEQFFPQLHRLHATCWLESKSAWSIKMKADTGVWDCGAPRCFLFYYIITLFFVFFYY